MGESWRTRLGRQGLVVTRHGWTVRLCAYGAVAAILVAEAVMISAHLPPWLAVVISVLAVCSISAAFAFAGASSPSSTMAAPQATPVARFELPSQPLFIGREQESERLTELLAQAEREGGPAMVVISGPSGVGKTALATSFARSISPHYPDGCFVTRFGDVADENAHGLEPDSSSEPLWDLLERLRGPADSKAATAPRDTAALAHHVAGETVQRRVLIVVDEVSDEAQIHPLLSIGPGSAVIVVARGRLVGFETAARLELGPLETDSAVALLGRLIGADGERRVADERQAAERVVRRAGNLPLAIRIIGAALVDSPYWSLTRMLAQLDVSDGGSPAHPLDLPFALLSDEERDAVRLLGMLDTYVVEPWMFTALWRAFPRVDESAVEDAEDAETTEETTLRLLDALARTRILERQTSGATVTPRYRMSEEVFAHARRQLEHTGKDAMRAQRALAAARDQRHSRVYAYRMLDEVVPSMERGDVARALDLAKDCVVCGKAERPPLEAKGLAALAEVQVELGGTRDAEVLLRLAATISDGAVDPRAERCLARIDRRRHKLKDAVERLESLANGRNGTTADEVRERVRALRELVVVHAERHEADEGTRAAVAAGALAMTLPGGGVDLMSGVLWAHGRLRRCAGDFHGADAILRRAAGAAAAGDQSLWLAWISHERGKAAFGRHDFAASASMR